MSELRKSKLVSRRAGSPDVAGEVNVSAQLCKGSSNGHLMLQEQPREQGLDELEKTFTLGWAGSTTERSTTQFEAGCAPMTSGQQRPPTEHNSKLLSCIAQVNW